MSPQGDSKEVQTHGWALTPSAGLGGAFSHLCTSVSSSVDGDKVTRTLQGVNSKGPPMFLIMI